MRRVDLRAATGATPGKIVKRILETLIDAFQCRGAELTITTKRNLKNRQSTWCPDTGVRIDYGGINVFVEEPVGPMSDDMFTCEGVFRVLLQTVELLTKGVESEGWAERHRVSVSAIKQLQDSLASTMTETEDPATG